MADKILIGSRVKEFAKSKKIPLYILEEKAGISKGSISKWDIIKPAYDKVCRVADILNIHIEELLREDAG